MGGMVQAFDFQQSPGFPDKAFRAFLDTGTTGAEIHDLADLGQIFSHSSYSNFR